MVRFRPASHDYTLQFSLTKRIILYISDLKYVYNCTLVICTYPTRRTCLLFISDLLHEITVHRRPVTCKNCALQTCTRDKYTSQNCYTWHLYTQTGYTWQLYIADWLHVTTVQFRPVTRDNCTFQTCYTWQLYISDWLHVTTVLVRPVTRDKRTMLYISYLWRVKLYISDLLHVFQMFDKNKDGKISSEELGCVLRTLGHEHSQKEVDDMIKNADTNGTVTGD